MLIANGYQGQFQQRSSQPLQVENKLASRPLAEKSFDPVSVSGQGRARFHEALEKIEAASIKGEFVTGYDSMVSLGMMALGPSKVEEWAGKGLELTEETIVAAAKAMQAGFQEILKKQGTSSAGSSTVLNVHQIVANSQEVPEWFLEEYQRALSSIENQDQKNAFENGATHISYTPDQRSAKAIGSYQFVSGQTVR